MLFNWPSPSIPKLLTDDYPNITQEDVSYLTVLPPIATIFASPGFDFYLKIFGRKYSLLSIAGFHLTAYVLAAIAKSKWIFYLSRIFFGVADIFMLGGLPIYIAEISTPKVRGTWGGTIMIFVFSGQFTVNAVGYFLEISTTAWILSAAPIAFFLVFIFMPESPYHYLWKNDRDRAAKSLRRLRDNREDIDEELTRIEADIKRQILDKAKFKDLFTVRSNRNALLLVFITFMIQSFSGCAAFNIYSQYFFQLAGQDINRGYAAMICAVTLATATMCAPTFVEKFDRKIAIVASSLICASLLTILAVYFAILRETSLDLSFMKWFPVAGMMVYLVGFGIGLSIVPLMLQGELFATNMRGHASAVLLITFCLSISVTSKLLHYLMTYFEMYVPFTFFATCTYLGSVYCYKFVPEIKGKTLEEIQQLLKQQPAQDNETHPLR